MPGTAASCAVAAVAGGKDTGGGIGMAAGGRVGPAARGTAAVVIEEPEEVAAATPKPGGGVVNIAVGTLMLDGGHPGMFGALTL